MKEHLTGAEVCPCVAGGKGEGLSAKCQCLSCEARLIKEGLVSDWWPHWTSRIWWGNLMHQNRYETRMRHIDNIYTNTHPRTRIYMHAPTCTRTHTFLQILSCTHGDKFHFCHFGWKKKCHWRNEYVPFLLLIAACYSVVMNHLYAVQYTKNVHCDIHQKLMA